jgi:hypothetical protein
MILFIPVLSLRREKRESHLKNFQKRKRAEMKNMMISPLFFTPLVMIVSNKIQVDDCTYFVLSLYLSCLLCYVMSFIIILDFEWSDGWKEKNRST